MKLQNGPCVRLLETTISQSIDRKNHRHTGEPRRVRNVGNDDKRRDDYCDRTLMALFSASESRLARRRLIFFFFIIKIHFAPPLSRRRRRRHRSRFKFYCLFDGDVGFTACPACAISGDWLQISQSTFRFLLFGNFTRVECDFPGDVRVFSELVFISLKFNIKVNKSLKKCVQWFDVRKFSPFNHRWH